MTSSSSSSSSSSSLLLNTLQTRFSLTSFRPTQLHAIEQIHAGNSALILMPTGGGKSLCYQLPSLTRPGMGVVVSPLLALMQDQVAALQARGVRAAMLGSSVSASERAAVMADLASDHPQTEIIYVTPELMCARSFEPVLASLRVALFAIDEAHCISSWGHDFRPAFLALRSLPKRFPDVPVVALTATATPRVRRDITDVLGLANARQIVQSFNRPNLALAVRFKDALSKSVGKDIAYLLTKPDFAREQLGELLIGDDLNLVGECGIIYVSKRKEADALAAGLSKRKISIAAYHAGLSSAKREAIQAAWSSGEIKVVAATVAFGMGIDKANVRFVIHLSVPSSLEAYYQEIGRAGRDGQRSLALAYYSWDDKRRISFLAQQPSMREKNLDPATARVRAKTRLGLVNAVIKYAEGSSCRRRQLLQYFGEDFNEPTPHCCDWCLDPDATKRAATMAEALGGVAGSSSSSTAGNRSKQVFKGPSRSAGPRGQKRKYALPNPFEDGDGLAASQQQLITTTSMAVQNAAAAATPDHVSDRVADKTRELGADDMLAAFERAERQEQRGRKKRKVTPMAPKAVDQQTRDQCLNTLHTALVKRDWLDDDKRRRVAKKLERAAFNAHAAHQKRYRNRIRTMLGEIKTARKPSALKKLLVPVPGKLKLSAG